MVYLEWLIFAGGKTEKKRKTEKKERAKSG